MAFSIAAFNSPLEATTEAVPSVIALLRSAVCFVIASTTPTIFRPICSVASLIAPPWVVMAVLITLPFLSIAAATTLPFLSIAVTISPPCLSTASFRLLRLSFMLPSILTIAVVLSASLTDNSPDILLMLFPTVLKPDTKFLLSFFKVVFSVFNWAFASCNSVLVPCNWVSMAVKRKSSVLLILLSCAVTFAKPLEMAVLIASNLDPNKAFWLSRVAFNVLMLPTISAAISLPDFVIVMRSNLPCFLIASVCVPMASVCVPMAVTILLPLSSTVSFNLLKPFKIVVLRVPKLACVCVSKVLMAPVFLLISTMIPAKPVERAKVSALNRLLKDAVWSLIALASLLVWVTIVALRSFCCLSSSRRSKLPFLSNAVMILPPVVEISVLIAWNPEIKVPSILPKDMLIPLRLTCVFVSSNVMAPVFLSTLTTTFFRPVSTTVLKASMRLPKVLVWSLMAAMSLVVWPTIVALRASCCLPNSTRSKLPLLSNA